MRSMVLFRSIDSLQHTQCGYQALVYPHWRNLCWLLIGRPESSQSSFSSSPRSDELGVWLFNCWVRIINSTYWNLNLDTKKKFFRSLPLSWVLLLFIRSGPPCPTPMSGVRQQPYSVGEAGHLCGKGFWPIMPEFVPPETLMMYWTPAWICTGCLRSNRLIRHLVNLLLLLLLPMTRSFSRCNTWLPCWKDDSGNSGIYMQVGSCIRHQR